MPTSRRLLLTAPGSSPRAGVLICGRRARCHGCRDSVRPPLIPAHPRSSPIIPAHPCSSPAHPQSSPIIAAHPWLIPRSSPIIPAHPRSSQGRSTARLAMASLELPSGWAASNMRRTGPRQHQHLHPKACTRSSPPSLQSVHAHPWRLVLPFQLSTFNRRPQQRVRYPACWVAHHPTARHSRRLS